MITLTELAWTLADATGITLNVDRGIVRGTLTQTVDLQILSMKLPVTIVSSCFVGGELFALIHTLGNLGLAVRVTKPEGKKSGVDIGVLDLALSGDLTNMLEKTTFKSSSEVTVMLRPFMVALYRKSGRDPFRVIPMKAA